MKMYLMVFGSGRTDTWKLEESEVDSIAKSLLIKYQESLVKVYQGGRIYKTWMATH